MIEQTRVIFTVQSRNDFKMILPCEATMCAEESEALHAARCCGEAQRYTEKLQLLGLTRDPYVARSEGCLRVADPVTWPAVDFPDICVYLTTHQVHIQKSVESL